MSGAGRLVCALFCLAVLGGAIAAQEENRPQDQQSPSQTPNDPRNAQTANLNPPDILVVVPNRPTFATTAETVQRGVFEIEYGVEAGDGHQNINGLLKFGVLDNLELRFANNPFVRNSGIAGTGDSGAGFKFKVFRQTHTRPTFSILYTALLPTAPASRGIGALGHAVQLLASKDFGKNHFDVNGGVLFSGRPGRSGFDRNYFTALSYSYPLTQKWGITGELAGFSRTNAVTPATMTLLGAVTYSRSPSLVFDFGGYFAVYGNLPRFTFATGLTYAVADLYHLHRRR